MDSVSKQKKRFIFPIEPFIKNSIKSFSLTVESFSFSSFTGFEKYCLNYQLESLEVLRFSKSMIKLKKSLAQKQK